MTATPPSEPSAPGEPPQQQFRPLMQPPREPYPSPPPGYYPYMAPRKPSWPVVIGVISIVLASMGLVCTPLTLVFNNFGAIQKSQRDVFPQWFLDAGTITSVIGIGQALLLLIAGILLAKRRPGARSLHLVYGWLGVAGAVASVVMLFSLNFASMPPAGKIGVVSGAIAIPVALAYPIFLLVWFMRARIAREMAEWPGFPMPNQE
ncbi:MAG: hypothetical protein ACE15C_16245 [Phycisphaerae bacterium]